MTVLELTANLLYKSYSIYVYDTTKLHALCYDVHCSTQVHTFHSQRLFDGYHPFTKECLPVPVIRFAWRLLKINHELNVSGLQSPISFATCPI